MSRVLILISLCLLLFGCFQKKKSEYPDCSSNDIEKIDSCLIGLTIKQVISKLDIDTTQFVAGEEPSGFISVFLIHIEDSCDIEITIDSAYCEICDLERNPRHIYKTNEKYLKILDRKVIAVSWWEKK